MTHLQCLAEDKSGTIRDELVATEISHVATELKSGVARNYGGTIQYRVRFGPVVPGFDPHTIVLYELPDEEQSIVQGTLKYEKGVKPLDLSQRYRISDRAIFPEPDGPKQQSSVPLLQAQDLQFYAVRHSAEFLSGTFQSLNEVVRVEGQRMHRTEISLLDIDSISVPVIESQLPNLNSVNRDLIERFRRRSFSMQTAFEARQMAYSLTYELRPEQH